VPGPFVGAGDASVYFAWIWMLPPGKVAVTGEHAGDGAAVGGAGGADGERLSFM